MSAITVSGATAAPTVLLPSRRARLGGLAGCAVLLALCIVASLAIGSQNIPFSEVVAAFTAYDGGDAHAIVRELRVPRTELGLLVGAALGAAGALMQGATRNPLAEPGDPRHLTRARRSRSWWRSSSSPIGTTAGYMAFALVGAAITAVLVYVLGAAGRGASAVSLALAGSVLAALFVSLTSAVLVFDTRTLDEFRHWSVGSLARRGAGVGASPWRRSSPPACWIALAAGRTLNALALGDDTARALGTNIALARGGSDARLRAARRRCGRGRRADRVRRARRPPHRARRSSGPTTAGRFRTAIVLGAALLLASDVLGRAIGAARRARRRDRDRAAGRAGVHLARPPAAS